MQFEEYIMINIETFMRNNDIKKRKTVEDWIAKGLIPGANAETHEVPNAARIPYTKARAKSTLSIYWSILQATRERKHVMPRLYNLTQAEFDYYIRQLVSVGYINVRIEEGITYYDCTINGSTCTQKTLIELFKVTVSAAAEGITRVAASVC